MNDTLPDAEAESAPEAKGVADAAAPASGGIAAHLRRHRTAWLIAAGATIIALAGGSVWAGSVLAGQDAQPAASVAPIATSTPAPTAEPRALPGVQAAVAPLRTCSVDVQAADGRLAEMQAHVRNAATGEVLFDRGGETPSRTASVLKVLTTAAALSVLGPDYRAETRVVAGAEPGTVVLVGGGDLTLSRTASGQESVYPGAAHLDDLAAQVRQAWEANADNPPITRLVLDSSYFTGDTWQPSWDRKELVDGYMPEITALQVDGDRNDPYSNTSERSEDPIGRAGQAFADELGGGLSIESGVAPEGAAQLGIVYSAPVSTLVQQTLIVSDNAVAEMLGRLVAIESGAGSDFAATNAGVLAGLAAYGLDTSGIVVVDGSGLSNDNAVAPAYITRLLMKVNAREGKLGILFDGLPVSGETGSLSYSDRFSGDSAVADGAVFAKTGWIDTGYTLAGVIYAADGTQLTFAIYALGDVGEDAKTAIDALTAAFYSCGIRLAN